MLAEVPGSKPPEEVLLDSTQQLNVMRLKGLANSPIGDKTAENSHSRTSANKQTIYSVTVSDLQAILCRAATNDYYC